MKNLILIITVMVLSACATTSTKPVKELTLEEKKVIGEYESIGFLSGYKWKILKNGIAQFYGPDGTIDEDVPPHKWKIVNSPTGTGGVQPRLHAKAPDGYTKVFLIIKAGRTDKGAVKSIRDIGPGSKDGWTFKKIK